MLLAVLLAGAQSLAEVGVHVERGAVAEEDAHAARAVRREATHACPSTQPDKTTTYTFVLHFMYKTSTGGMYDIQTDCCYGAVHGIA